MNRDSEKPFGWAQGKPFGWAQGKPFNFASFGCASLDSARDKRDKQDERGMRPRWNPGRAHSSPLAALKAEDRQEDRQECLSYQRRQGRVGRVFSHGLSLIRRGPTVLKFALPLVPA